jgi:hypothetical protein
MKYRATVVVGVLAAIGWAQSVEATPITFTGSGGNLVAQVAFDVSGTTLVVTLTNTSSSDVLAPSDVLTAVFFDLAGDPILSRLSAVVAPGSSVSFGITDPGNVVGGEMAYKTGLVGAPGNASQGISSAGLGLFGPGDRFPGNDLQAPASPNGLQYGLTSAGDNTSTGNTRVTGTDALIKNAVVYTLGGLPSGFLLSGISNVNFQYGTSLSDTSIPGLGLTIDLVSSALLFGSGLIAMVWVQRRRRLNQS